MKNEYGTHVGRIGIILLLTGIVITLVGYFKSFSNSNRIDSNIVTYLEIGLIVVGIVLLLIFVLGFIPNNRKHP